MNRVITIFDKESEKLINKIEVNNIPLLDLQNAFEIEHHNPMYDMFEITKKQEHFIKNFIEIYFDFDRFQYYIESED